MLRTSIAAATLAVFASSAPLLAQNPRGTAQATLSGKKVSVEYGRPSLKGRDVLSEAPAGTVWRTGADKSTTFTTEADLTVGGKAVPKGSYSLFTKRVDDKSWALIFNKQTGQWGTDHDASQDLVQVPLTWKQDGAGSEQFTIDLAGSGAQGEIKMSWGKHVLSAPIQAK